MLIFDLNYKPDLIINEENQGIKSIHLMGYSSNAMLCSHAMSELLFTQFRAQQPHRVFNQKHSNCSPRAKRQFSQFLNEKKSSALSNKDLTI